jgi:multidrug transporter EmrE-like cation transporter
MVLLKVHFYFFNSKFITAITIVGCMFTLSIVMKNIPMGITYASFAGLVLLLQLVVGILNLIKCQTFIQYRIDI